MVSHKRLRIAIRKSKNSKRSKSRVSARSKSRKLKRSKSKNLFRSKSSKVIFRSRKIHYHHKMDLSDQIYALSTLGYDSQKTRKNSHKWKEINIKIIDSIESLVKRAQGLADEDILNIHRAVIFLPPDRLTKAAVQARSKAFERLAKLRAK